MTSSLELEACAGPDVTSARSRLYRIELPPGVARRYDRDRTAGHRFVMSLLPDGLGDHPRARTCTLWRIGPGADHLDILTTASVRGIRVADTPTLTDGQRVRLSAVLEAVRSRVEPIDADNPTPRSVTGHWRAPRVRVPDTELSGWIVEQLAKHGWHTDMLRTLRTRRVTRRAKSMHLVECLLDCTVTDAVTAQHALLQGVGRGRSFGAGMITCS